MIHPDATFEIKKIPLYLINTFEYQPRYMDRLAHYVALMRQPEHEGWYPGFLSVSPAEHGRYTLLDGHHRMTTYIITGRPEALCVVIRDPDQARQTPQAAEGGR